MNTLAENKKLLFLGLLAVAMFFAGPFTLSKGSVWAVDSTEDLEDDIDNIEDKIKKEQKEKLRLESELSKIQNSVYSTQSQINKTRDLIKESEKKISRMETEVISMDDKLELQKALLGDLVKEMYFLDKKSGFFSTILNSRFFNFLERKNGMIEVNEKMISLMAEIEEDKKKVKDAHEEILNTKEDHEKLLAVKVDQQHDLLAEKAETQADIQSKEKTISQLQSKLNSLRTEYSKLLGKDVSTEDILEAAKFAAKATGMSRAFLLGVLIQESNKGQNVGTCDYKESKMSSARLEIFKDICEELDYDYKKMKVSCPPKSYKGTGGAMGVAQFMPDTWRGYEDRISSLTGHNLPDPWSLVDGVTAMASKLSKDGASSKKRFDEAKSYCVYLAGGNWGYYCFGTDKYKDSYENVNCWGTSIRNYGEKVLCLKDNYEQFYD